MSSYCQPLDVGPEGMFKLDHGVDQFLLEVTPSLLVTVADSIKALADPARHYKPVPNGLINAQVA